MGEGLQGLYCQAFLHYIRADVHQVGVEAHWEEKRAVKDGAVCHIVQHCFRNLVNHSLKALDWSGSLRSVPKTSDERRYIRVAAFPASDTRHRLVTAKKEQPNEVVFCPMTVSMASYWHFSAVGEGTWSELAEAVKAAWEVACRVLSGDHRFKNGRKIQTDVIYGLLVDDLHLHSHSIGHSFIMEIIDEESFKLFLSVAAALGLKCPHIVARVMEKDADKDFCWVRWADNMPEPFERKY